MEVVGKILIYAAICCGLKIILSILHQLVMEAMLLRVRVLKEVTA